MFIPPTGWQRAVIGALLTILLIVLLVLTAPGWLSLPFLPKDRRDTLLKLAKVVLDGIRAIMGGS